MSFGAVLLLAVGLAMDATAVAAARGLAAPVLRAGQVARVALLFGAAQALMPLLGWFIGDRVGPLVAAWDHWIAFVLLVAIGGKMLWESRRPAEDGQGGAGQPDPFRMPLLLALALATSIDAFAVGVTLPMLGAPMVMSLVCIGVTTALLSAAGVVVGRRSGQRLGRRLDAFGGIILIGLGVKILVTHLRAG
jgi:manganese efflux pump family protein